MTCDRVQDLLSLYLDGELEGTAKAEFEAHLSACPECADLLARMRAAMAAFSGFPEVEPGPGLRRKLLAIPSRAPRFRDRAAALFRPALQPVWAAAMGVLLLAGVYLALPNKGLINRTISQGLHRGFATVERLYVKAGSVSDRIGAFANNVIDSAKAASPVGRGKT